MVAESVSFSCTVPAPEYECGSGSEIRTRIRFRLLTRDSGPVPAPKYKCGSGSGYGPEIVFGPVSVQDSIASVL